MSELSQGAELSRRNFLKVGAMGALALSTVSATAVLTGCASQPVANGFQLFRESDLEVLRALLPVVLVGRLKLDDTDAREKALHALDGFLYGSSEAAHKQLGQLFDLLSMSFTRYTIAGLSSPWSEASAEDIRHFLERWKKSRFQLLRGGHIALTQMISMAWYLQPETWASIGYEPPKVIHSEEAA